MTSARRAGDPGSRAGASIGPQTHRRACEWFAQACDLDPAARAKFVADAEKEDRAAAELLGQLLARDLNPDSRLDRPALSVSKFGSSLRALGAELEEHEPLRVGDYRIVGKLGVGGMGVVFEAEQEHPRRRVALKLMRRGLVGSQALRRFEYEAEVLAWLAHPGIAQVYDAGAAQIDGERRPFFVMELVRGVALDEYIRGARLSIAERVELVARIADAVEHAHQKGVIHRDLKPSNVLVEANGTPRVLDFGVARAVHDGARTHSLVTAAGELIGTLAYMSPEQVGVDPAQVDVRSDVYSLGVLLFELLSGRRPLELDGLPIHLAAQKITEEEPPRLGSLDRALRGDLETIASHALEKDRSRRYGSAGEFAADLRRHLGDQPILARPPSASYQIAKFARRNRALVVAAATVLVSLVIGLVVSVRMYVVAERARIAERDMRGRAERALETLDSANRYLSDLLGASSPWSQGVSTTMAEALERAASDVAEAFPEAPDQRATVLTTLGRTQFQLGEWDSAIAQLTTARELRVEHTPDNAMALAEIDEGLAMAYLEKGELELARRAAQRAVDSEATWSPPAVFRSGVRRSLAKTVFALDGVAQAEKLAREALEILLADPSAAEADLALARQQLAYFVIQSGRFEEGEALAREAVEGFESVGQGDSFDAAIALNSLGTALDRLGRTEEALAAMERVLSIGRRLAADSHPVIAACLHNLAVLYAKSDRLEEAEPLMRRAIELARASNGERHVEVGVRLANLGAILQRRRKSDEALATLDEADGIALEANGPTSLLHATVLFHRGVTLRELGRRDEADAAFAESEQIRVDALGEEHPDVQRVRDARAEMRQGP